jgi:hypothetical protein
MTKKICECGKEVSKTNFYKHKKICKERQIILKDREIKQLKLQVQTLQNQLDLSKQTVQITNNYNFNQNIEKMNNINLVYNNLQPLDFNSFDESTNRLENRHLETPESLAEFALNVPLKDKICCTDVKRQIIRYKEKGKLKTDPKMEKIQNRFYNSLIENANITEENTPNIHDDKFIKKFIKTCCESTTIKKNNSNG